MTLIPTAAPAPTLAVGLAAHLKRNPLAEPTVTADTLRQARAIFRGIMVEHGFKGKADTALLTAPDGNVKIAKSRRAVWSLTLAPAMSSGLINTCVRYADCQDVCALTSGKGGLPVVQRSRAARTALLYRAPEAFAIILAEEVGKAGRLAHRGGFAWGIRLNAASDIPWEHAAPWIFKLVEMYHGTAYDYTKSWAREDRPGYRLVRSIDSRQSDDRIREAVAAGRNVAVVLPIAKGQPTPRTWLGLPAIDGDVSDDRSADPHGVVVVLRAKGKLRSNPDHALVRTA